MASAEMHIDLSSDRYRIERELGRGGMGSVYLAFDEERQERVALKVLDSRGSMNLVRFKREFRAALRLDHPNCLRVYDFEDGARTTFFTMEYVTAGALDGGRRDSFVEVADIALQVLQALDHLHGKQIIHRDLKHANLLVDARGGTPVYKLADFGIVQMGERTAALGSLQGSLAYLSPELANGDLATPRSDLYALGVILYDLLTGEHPLPLAEGMSSAEWLAALRDRPHVPVLHRRPDAPPALARVVECLLEKDPARRYPTAAAAYDAVRAWADTLPAWTGTQGGAEHAAEGEKAPSAPLPVAPAPLPLPLVRAPYLGIPGVVGRRTELAALRGFLDDALARGTVGPRPVCFGLEAPAGVGKSCLAAEATRMARALGADLVTATCRPEPGQPYGAVRELVRGATQRPGVLAPAASNSAETRSFTDLGTVDGAATDPGGVSGSGTFSGSATFSTLDVAPDAAARSGSAESMSGAHWQFLRAAWDGLVTRAAARPVLIVVDDCQWADAASLELLHFFARGLLRAATAGTPVRAALLLASRPAPSPATLVSLRDELREMGAWLGFELGPMTLEDTVSYLARSLIVPTERVAHAFAARLHDRVDGNPLFLRQVLATLVQHRLILDDAGGWVLDPEALDRVALPRSLHDAIDDQVARLAAETMQVLVAAAILGRAFEWRDLLTLTGLDEPLVLDCLDEAIRAEFVEDHEGFRFAHDRIRDAIYARVPGETRRLLHGRAAERMVQHAREDRSFAVLAAHHFEAAERPADAWPLALEAADHAMALHAYRRASEAFEQAFRLAAQVGARVPEGVVERFGDAAVQAGRYDLARAQFTEALAGTELPLARAALIDKLADTELRSGRTDEARAQMERMLAQVGAPAPRSRTGVLLGTLPFVLRFLLATLLPRVFTRTTRAVDGAVPELVSRTSARLAEAYYWTDYDRASYFQMASIDAAERVGPSATLSVATAQQGYILSGFGVRGLAFRYHQRARVLAEAYGAPTERGWEAILRAMSHGCAGNVARHLEEADRAVAHIVESLEPLRMAQAWWIQGEGHLAGGNPWVAEDVAQELIAASEELGVRRNRGWGLEILGIARLRQGRLAEAVAILGETVDVSNAAEDVSTALAAASRWAVALAVTGETARAVEIAAPTADEWHARKFRHVSCIVDGAMLVACALHVQAGGTLTAAQERTRARCARVGDSYTKCIRYARPSYLLGRAAWRHVRHGGARDAILAAVDASRAANVPGELHDVLVVAARVLGAGDPSTPTLLAEVLRHETR